MRVWEDLWKIIGHGKKKIFGEILGKTILHEKFGNFMEKGRYFGAVGRI